MLRDSARRPAMSMFPAPRARFSCFLLPVSSLLCPSSPRAILYRCQVQQESSTTTLRQQFRASVREAIGSVSVSAHSLRAYNPARCGYSIPPIDAHKVTLPPICSSASSALSANTRKFARSLKASAECEFSRRRSLERRRWRRSSEMPSSVLLKLCAHPIRAGALAGSLVLEERGDMSTVPSCRSPQKQTHRSPNMSATLLAGERERLSHRAPSMEHFCQRSDFETRCVKEDTSRSSSPLRSFSDSALLGQKISRAATCERRRPPIS